MKIYVFENSYYIGDNLSQELKAKAQVKEITIPQGKTIKVVNYEIELIDEVGDGNVI